MNQKFLKNAWLRVCMIAAVMTTAFVGTSRAEDVTASLSKFTATSGYVDGLVTYSTTGALSGHAITVPNSSDKFTVSLTAEALSYGSKIKSIEFVASVAHEWRYSVDNGNNRTVSSSKVITVSGLDCASVAFSHQYTYTNLTIQSVTVTYTAPTNVPFTLTAGVNEEGWGTVSVVGNAITAIPSPGFVYADPAYTLTGTATVTQEGNYFIVTGIEDNSTVNVTINFARSTVAPEYKVDFEANDLSAYEDNWDFSGNFNQNTGIHHGGSKSGQAYDGGTITTIAPVASPGTLTFWGRGYSSASWKVSVSSDKNEWTEVESFAVSGDWTKYEVNLASYTNVYVRISCAASSGNCGYIDDIDLTTLASLFKVSVGSVGYSTFCSDRALDFSDSAIKVFYATASGTTLTFHQITKLPANTGVLLYKEGGITDDEIPVFTGTPDAVTGNVFVRGTGAAVSYVEENKQYNYILFNGEDGIGFYKAKNNKVATNRAYIHLASITGVKSFGIDLDNATAIKTIDNGQQTAEGAIYNVAGQRINKLQKGINIVNGKKILF